LEPQKELHLEPQKELHLEPQKELHKEIYAQFIEPSLVWS
jgi:hypothetical protein